MLLTRPCALSFGLIFGGLLCACPGQPAPARPCTQHLWGDGAQPMQLQLVGVGPNGGPVELRDGDPLALLVPPQGGSVLYAGARAANLMACNVNMSAFLREADGGSALTNLDARSSNLEEQHGSFLGPRSDHLTSDLPNIPACPDALGKGVAGKNAILDLTLTDAAGKVGKAQLRVVPTCPPGDARCACLCGPNYRSGGC